MAHDFYPQSPFSDPPKTFTVADLISKLSKFDPSLPVVFQSPTLGCFGPETIYALDKLALVSLEGREEWNPPGVSVDEETGDESAYEGWTDVYKPWKGVVIG
jgi:hypothetical protein